MSDELTELRAFKKRAMAIPDTLKKLAGEKSLHPDENSRAAWRTGVFDCKLIVERMLEGADA